jgi:DNA replication protein DnaC
MLGRKLEGKSKRELRDLDFVTARDNVVFLGPPGTGKTHCETAYTVRTKSRGRIGPAAVVMTRSLIGPR